MSDVVKTAAITVLGSGFAPFASGTWGSLAAVVLFLPIAVLVTAGVWDVWWASAWTLLGVLLASIASVAWGEWALERFRSKDPKPFVLDELSGQWVSLLWLPGVAVASWSGLAVVLASQFFLFRLFDVLKPPPARQLERLPAGWGVLCDDLMAGVYANLAGQLLWRWTPLAAALGLAG